MRPDAAIAYFIAIVDREARRLVIGAVTTSFTLGKKFDSR